MLGMVGLEHGIVLTPLNIQASIPSCLAFVEESDAVLFLDERDGWQANMEKVRFVPFASDEKPIRPSISLVWADNSNLSSNKMSFVRFILSHFEQ